MAIKRVAGNTLFKGREKDMVSKETRSFLLPLLQEVQDRKGYIPDRDMQEIADRLGIHPVEVYSVVTFYSFLNEKKRGKHVIRISGCMPGELAGSGKLIKSFEKALKIKTGESTRDGKIALEMSGCLGMCDKAPAVMVDDLLVGRVTSGTVTEIVKCLRGNKKLKVKETGKRVKREGPVIFSPIEPCSGLKKALENGSKDVLTAVTDSNLKGRGGAGFPVGLKWDFAAKTGSDRRFVVCNADEGEPGTFKDKVLLEEYLSPVIEGMVIAGFAIGADTGFLYLRGEYRYMVPRIKKELARSRKDGILGKDILGKKGFDFDIELRLGSGAYVCGEETALIESLEGNRGEPRNKPPFPVNTGYFGYPTVVNNVETFAAVTHILAKGTDWFKKTGTDRSSGSKLISVSGDCKKPGVYEIPFGTTIKEILKIADAKDVKAVQVGGAAGVCVSGKDFKRMLAYEDLSTGGSIMVFGRNRNMLDAARNFLRFFKEESCGQCTPCRQGIPVLLEGAEMLKNGECSARYLKDICSLSETMRAASKCGLGQTSPDAFMSIVENFPGDYELSGKHKKEKRFNG
ncbi:MAG: NAD(P)H-dependent oxidoreductase subunit E [Candidatus Omnitrophota bacterium]|nr:NAD(P)H-dependent oxidoreductase subunit E [Candidatus Omnitrophota bacterium]